MSENELKNLVRRLIRINRENEWIEFKLNYHTPEEIGQTISALANGAAISNQPFGYLLFGVSDENHSINGTTFKPFSKKINKEDFEHWLTQRLNPRIDIRIYELTMDVKPVVLFEIPASQRQPVSFQHIEYIRVSSIIRKLSDYPEKERKIWGQEHHKRFEKESALAHITGSEVVELLDTFSYFSLIQLPYPKTQQAVLDKFISEKFITRSNGSFSITNLGALLFAKNLSDFENLARKSVRIIEYSGKNKIKTIKDHYIYSGYAAGFKSITEYINNRLPQNEEIGRSVRRQVHMYPDLAVRELTANSLIHQDFWERGGPVIEIYSDRIEFSNPGVPVITPIRFIDDYQSRNEILADILRRLGICEEKGSGIDKVIQLCEDFHLPAPDFLVHEKHTRAVLFAHQSLKQMDKKDKIRACYQHCSLRYISNEKMTNQSLRDRFHVDEKNSAIISRIISDTKSAGLIKDDDPESKSFKFAKYIPFWV